MSNKEKISFSFLIATAGMLIDVAHKKIGGLLSGGNYSDPHSWEEMKSLVPEFLFFSSFYYFGF